MFYKGVPLSLLKIFTNYSFGMNEKTPIAFRQIPTHGSEDDAYTSKSRHPVLCLTGT